MAPAFAVVGEQGAAQLSGQAAAGVKGEVGEWGGARAGGLPSSVHE